MIVTTSINCFVDQKTKIKIITILIHISQIYYRFDFFIAHFSKVSSILPYARFFRDEWHIAFKNLEKISAAL